MRKLTLVIEVPEDDQHALGVLNNLVGDQELTLTDEYRNRMDVQVVSVKEFVELEVEQDLNISALRKECLEALERILNDLEWFRIDLRMERPYSTINLRDTLAKLTDIIVKSYASLYIEQAVRKAVGASLSESLNPRVSGEAEEALSGS